MILGTVVGTIWATEKDPRLNNLKMAIIRPSCWYQPSHDVDNLVAVDQIGARIGQDVLVCCGAPGRWQAGEHRSPIEASVMAIVDRVELSKEMTQADHQHPVFNFADERRPETLVLFGGATMAEAKQI
jgi:microcompartment protein CcmK/EutM